MLTLLSSQDAREVREFLTAAGYTHANLLKNPAMRDLSYRGHDLARLHGMTAEPNPWNVLVRWFIVGAAQDGAAAEQAIPGAVLERMMGCGMLSREGDRIASNVLLTPCDQMWFAADLPEGARLGAGEEPVAWPSPTSRMVQQFSVRKPSRATLDLGAGCGLQGIMARAYSEQVVCTDLNPRGELFVRFNAALNEVDGIECLSGDTYQPVLGRTFDLILCNPPFYVTPPSGEAGHMYFESGMELDRYCRRVVREGAQLLNDGGFLQADLEWVQLQGETWKERLTEWVAGLDCDAWIIRGYVRDPAGYAEQRLLGRPQAEAGETFQRWMAYYRERGVEEIHGGILALRKRAGQNWVRFEEIEPNTGRPFGDAVLEGFAIQDAISAGLTDEQLLSCRPRLSADAELEYWAKASGRAWKPKSFKLHLSGGLPAALVIEAQVAHFLAWLDGEITLHEAADRLAGMVQAPVDQVRFQCCAVVRKLAGCRFLLLM